MEKRFENEIDPKIRKLESEYRDHALANELRKIKAQLTYDSAENVKRVLDFMDRRVSQALEICENEYERIYEPIIDSLVKDGRIEEVRGFFDNEEKLGVALRLYSHIPLQRINELQEQIRAKERMGKKYAKLVTENATADCDPLRAELGTFLMEYMKLILERERIARQNLTEAEFIRLKEIIRWITDLFDMQKLLEKRAKKLDENNEKLLDLLIFTQRYLSEEYLLTLTEEAKRNLGDDYLSNLIRNSPAPEITRSEQIGQLIEEFLPNIFLSEDMTSEEKEFCQDMRIKLAECIFDRIEPYFV